MQGCTTGLARCCWLTRQGQCNYHVCPICCCICCENEFVRRRSKHMAVVACACTACSAWYTMLLSLRVAATCYSCTVAATAVRVLLSFTHQLPYLDEHPVTHWLQVANLVTRRQDANHILFLQVPQHKQQSIERCPDSHSAPQQIAITMHGHRYTYIVTHASLHMHSPN